MSTSYIPARSSADLAKMMREHAPKMTLYNGADVWFQFEYAGSLYWIPPDLDGKLVPHPVHRVKENGRDVGPLMVKADGRLPVGTRFGLKLGPTFTPVGFGALDGQAADDIVKYALERYGPNGQDENNRGIEWLIGDEFDSERIISAKRAYRRFRRQSAETEVATRREYVQKFQAKNPGVPVPPPNASQRAAQRFLDNYGVSEERGQFVCEYQCSDYETFEELAKHMKAAHGKELDPPKTAKPIK